MENGAWHRSGPAGLIAIDQGMPVTARAFDPQRTWPLASFPSNPIGGSPCRYAGRSPTIPDPSAAHSLRTVARRIENDAARLAHWHCRIPACAPIVHRPPFDPPPAGAHGSSRARHEKSNSSAVWRACRSGAQNRAKTDRGLRRSAWFMRTHGEPCSMANLAQATSACTPTHPETCAPRVIGTVRTTCRTLSYAVPSIRRHVRANFQSGGVRRCSFQLAASPLPRGTELS